MTERPTNRPRRPNVLLLVLGAIAAVAIIAVVVSTVGGDDDGDDTNGTAGGAAETRDVTVDGDALPKLDDPANDLAIGKQVPVLHGQSFGGKAVTIGDNGPAVVVFLAHWCPHCRREVPVMVKWVAGGGVPAGVGFYAVTTNVDPAAPNYPPSEWLAREHWAVPTPADSKDGAAATAFGLSAFPYFVAFNADGVVVARTSGELEVAQLEALFEAARAG
jgi:thiol-disulfide isomerase/thioredoxin